MTNLIFLDIDGVLNCEVFYKNKFESRKKSKSDPTYAESNICTERLSWLNQLCKETDAAVVISSTWRMGRTVEEISDLLKSVGATFEIIGVTPYNGYERGTEISKWLREYSEFYFGLKYYDFFRYAIIDDDGDMLLSQQAHFFQTDSYSGLTPNLIHKIKVFFTHKTF